MAMKKTLYEILGIPAGAGCEAILAAHREKMQALKSDESRLSHEEFDYRMKLLNLALDTLSDPLLRRDYDDKLMARRTSSLPPDSAIPPAGGGALARRAQALALRADALALRAEAMSINTDLSTFRTEEAPSRFAPVFGVLSFLRPILIAVGAFAAIAMVVQWSFVFFAVRNTQHAAEAAATAARAEEQLVLQEYYQKYGVRPANAAEIPALERERQRKEEEERVAERERRKMEADAQRFQEDSRRVGEQVSADLRRAEERIRREEAYKKAQQEEEERLRAAAEEERLRLEQEKWRTVLSR